MKVSNLVLMDWPYHGFSWVFYPGLDLLVCFPDSPSRRVSPFNLKEPYDGYCRYYCL
jgi:hypothetical protein